MPELDIKKMKEFEESQLVQKFLWNKIITENYPHLGVKTAEELFNIFRMGWDCRGIYEARKKNKGVKDAN